MINIHLHFDNSAAQPKHRTKEVFGVLRGVHKIAKANYGLNGRTDVSFDDTILDAIPLTNGAAKIAWERNPTYPDLVSMRLVVDGVIVACINPYSQKNCEALMQLSATHRCGVFPAPATEAA